MLFEILSEHGCKKVTLERCVVWCVKIFRRVELRDLPSVMKANLAYLFSQRTKQELPEIKKKVMIIPPCARKFFKDATSRPDGFRSLGLLWDLLQAKRLVDAVPKEFIKMGYEKHSKSMAKEPVPLPSFMLENEQFIRDFGRRTARYLNFYQNSLPNGKATFFMKQKDGGRAINIRKEQMSKVRVEPVYLSVHGFPGLGKSLMLQKISRDLCKRLGFSYPEDVYVRNCATKHWDGYRGQPICILDDVGALGKESTDFGDLISLVSSSTLVLPMADIREKGTIFNSSFILSASNYPKHFIQQPVSGGPVSFMASIRRRFLTVDLKKDESYEVFRVEPQMMRDDDTGLSSILPPQFQIQEVFPSLGTLSLTSIVDRMVGEFDRKNSFVQEHLETHFSQKLYDFTVYDHGRDSLTFLEGDETDPLFGDFATHFKRELVWPKEPGCEARVQTVAIPEPLKVRVITKAFAETQCLKPFQEAMWKALGTYPEFKLTHGVDPKEAVDDLKVFKGPEHFWLSGDYEAATDNLSLPASQWALDLILQEIGDDNLTRWAKWENGEHWVHYPAWTGIEPVYQRNGQLMGSFLSFPLLCLLNACTIRSITPHFRVNGDDLLALLRKEEFPQWQERATQLGLIPSIGKNFFSKKFCTINSQIFCEGEQIAVGRPSLRFRSGKPIGRCFHDLHEFLGKLPNVSRFVRRNLPSLKQTLRSIDVPVTHGGLGKVFTKNQGEDSQTRRLIYLTDLLKDHERRFDLAGREIRLIKNPFVTTDARKTLAPLLKVFASVADPGIGMSSDKGERDLSFSDLRRTLKVIQKIPPLRDFLKNGSLESAPPLPESGFTITTSQTLSKKVWADWASEKLGV